VAEQRGAESSALAAQLRRELAGEVRFDAFTRGMYSTDASIYQIEPLGVVRPRSAEDVRRALQIAAEHAVPVLARGAGTSQVGQTVARALVIDTSVHLNRLLELDVQGRSAWVEPGIVLDQLNAQLRPHGLCFPVDVSTASRATIGGMAGNNSCGSRSIRYGNMVHNVRAIAALLADGTRAEFGPLPADLAGLAGQPRYRELALRLRAIAEREREEIARRFPQVLRRVGGYNLDMLGAGAQNLAHLLVGSEGTLAFFERLQLELAPIPRARVLGICQFESFYRAMDATQHLVALAPTAVELVDRTLLELAREIPLFKPVLERCVRGAPDALLLVEFSGDDPAALEPRLAALEQCMGDLGFAGAVTRALEPALQSAVWELRTAGLNIAMSMKGDGKPVSFIEDCAVRLEDLAEYTDRLTQVFQKYGTRGTWYAHASVGCLHVRPILNMKEPEGASKMRAIAEEAFALVREYRGSHSGEHGDGIARSEFHESMFGARLVRAFEEVKDLFDPGALLNPGRITRAPRMDDRTLFRYAPEYRAEPRESALDWSEWGGLLGAVEMCNNNGACRKATGGVMCPSFRATQDEEHSTRGRANALRLALSGQLGRGAFSSPRMAEALELCVSCKGCRRECPTGVDMARMKIEFLAQRRREQPLALRERLIAYLPRYAPFARHLAPLLNLRDRLPGAAAAGERWLGLAARRSLPRWRRDVFAPPAASGPAGGREVALLSDTFTTYFEPENARAASRVLVAAGYRVLAAGAPGERPLCCGRSFLSVGLVDEARRELRRLLAALRPLAERGVPIVGLEPSCLLTLRDELRVLLPAAESGAVPGAALLFEEFLSRERSAGRAPLALGALPQRRALLHGHCHQKAFGALGAVEQVLRWVPGLEVKTAEAGCCGMAGSFGFEAAHYDVSMRMGELGLLPAVRATAHESLIVADGTSCRHQIRDGAGREALHVARVLDASLRTVSV
jgi:FAD/FMN-containing dehydrogenase/Fe-S oxidoreductase